MRGLSSAGRAPALHAGGQRFDPARLHRVEKLCGFTILRKEVEYSLASSERSTSKLDGFNILREH